MATMRRRERVEALHQQSQRPVSAQNVGASVFQVPVLAFSTLGFDSNSGNGTGRSISDAQFSFQIHSTYKLVPEPSAITPVMIGGVASLLVHRNRRAGTGRSGA